MIDFELSTEVSLLEEACRRLARERLAPAMREAEARGSWDERVLADFRELGVGGLLVAPWLGGECDPLAAVVALEALAAGDAGGLPAADQPGLAAGALSALALALAPDGDFAASCPEGTVERGRLAELVERCRAGHATVGLAVVESLEGRIEACWVPGTAPPDALVVVAGDDLGLAERDAIDWRPARLGALHASGGLACAVGADRLAVRVATPLAPLARGSARLWVAGALLGVGRAALEHATAYGRSRIVFGLPVLGHQANAHDLAWAHATLEAARLSVHAAALALGDTWRALRGLADAPPGAQATGAPEKPRALAATSFSITAAYREARQAALEATDLALGLLGGHGYMRDEPVEKWWREARALAMLAGGDEGALAELADEVLDAADRLVVAEVAPETDSSSSCPVANAPSSQEPTWSS
jgi:alkylation response protein AidB-like acyl-CoA dehydrogenase